MNNLCDEQQRMRERQRARRGRVDFIKIKPAPWVKEARKTERELRELQAQERREGAHHEQHER
jgi:hypothetical protein